MKKFLMVCIMVMWAGSAMALPWDDLSSDWVVSGSMDYWTPTDLTSSVDGDSMFAIEMEQASYESAFGLYTVDASGYVDQKFQVFAAAADVTSGYGKEVNVNFWNDNGNWKITANYSDDQDLTNDDWVSFGSQFGFYYDVDMNFNSTVTADNPDGAFESDYTFYSDNSLNTEESGIEHIMTAYNSDKNSLHIYLDDQISKYVTKPDGDFTDMTVFMNDVAPVPEPATLLLLGSGLVGLAFLKRRKS